MGLRNRGALSLWHCSKASLIISVVNLCNECATKETTSSISKKTATLGNVSIYLFATVWSNDLTRPETCCHSESSLVVLEPKSVFMGSPLVQCGMFYVNSNERKELLALGSRQISKHVMSCKWPHSLWQLPLLLVDNIYGLLCASRNVEPQYMLI